LLASIVALVVVSGAIALSAWVCGVIIGFLSMFARCRGRSSDVSARDSSQQLRRQSGPRTSSSSPCGHLSRSSYRCSHYGCTAILATFDLRDWRRTAPPWVREASNASSRSLVTRSPMLIVSRPRIPEVACARTQHVRVVWVPFSVGLSAAEVCGSA
jgi:hypothetical protein